MKVIFGKYNRQSKLLILFILLQACNNTAIKPIEFEMTTDDLLNGYVLLGEQAHGLKLPQEDILELDEDMDQFLEKYVINLNDKAMRFDKLISALFSPGIRGMEYSLSNTMTAKDTFSVGKGNCLSFSNMIVALVRHAGIEAYFQEVKTPPVWNKFAGKNSYTFIRHINVYVKFGFRKSSISVDVNAPRGLENLRTNRLSDKQAFALYYNNIAVDYLMQNDKVNTFRYLKKAILLAPEDPSIWVNLGTLYRRHGLYKHAEFAYFHAMGIKNNDYMAMSNLVSLYNTTGEKDQSAYYLAKIQHTRNSNPYYRFDLAQRAFENEHFLQAEEHLLFALKKIDYDKRFYSLMADVQEKLQNSEDAQKYLNKSNLLAEYEKDIVSHKIIFN